MNFFTWLIKSDYIRAQVLAAARHLVTSIGAGLVLHGYADNGMVEAAAGLVTASLGFYLSQKDVKNVDAKIQVAIAATPPTTPEEEVEITRKLNEISRHGIGK